MLSCNTFYRNYYQPINLHKTIVLLSSITNPYKFNVDFPCGRDPFFRLNGLVNTSFPFITAFNESWVFSWPSCFLASTRFITTLSAATEIYLHYIYPHGIDRTSAGSVNRLLNRFPPFVASHCIHVWESLFFSQCSTDSLC